MKKSIKLSKKQFNIIRQLLSQYHSILDQLRTLLTFLGVPTSNLNYIELNDQTKELIYFVEQSLKSDALDQASESSDDS